MRVPSTPRWSRLSVRHFFRRNSHAQVYRSRPHASDCRRRRRCRLVLGYWSRVGLLRRLLRRLRFKSRPTKKLLARLFRALAQSISSGVPARAYRVGSAAASGAAPLYLFEPPPQRVPTRGEGVPADPIQFSDSGDLFTAGGRQCSVLWSLLGPLQIKRRSARFSGVHACAMYSSLVAPHGSTFLSEKLPCANTSLSPSRF